MSDAPRSNSGCWTCRVRRKKCDETRPACVACVSLHLPCYGYGAKPAWMDRGVREKEVAKSLRSSVKHTLSLQRQRLSRQSSDTSRTLLDGSVPLNHLEDDSYDLSSMEIALDADSALHEAFSSVVPGRTSPLSNANPTPAAAALRGTARIDVKDLLLTGDSWAAPPAEFEEDQAGLLMHFFDHVLPSLFPFYNPSIQEGGRGWLLSVLTNTKPLYHVVLSLSAYHQQSILVHDSGVPCRASLRKLEERHIECIKVLRRHLETSPEESRGSGGEDGLEIMACITMLIVLELFRGDTKDWQMHLKAVSRISLKSTSRQLKSGPLRPAYNQATEFFTGVTMWYDILSCASTGLQPFSIFDNAANDKRREIRFDKLMGCENWLMRLIWEIATLYEWKARLVSSGGLSTWELVRRAADIEMKLETGLIASSKRAPAAAPADGTPTISSSARALIREITHIFASAALVYLQVVTSGPHAEIPEIRHGVSRTMAALDALPDKDIVRNLLWPVCIAGCMATVEHEPYWRELVSNASRERWSFGYPHKVLEVMEECWRLRARCLDSAVGVDWMTAMKRLDMRVLLV